MADGERIPARFQVGERVAVLELNKAGHVRTPHYIRGRAGEIIEFVGYFLNPEDLSVGITSGPVYPLYRVRFLLKDLWPDYARNPGDELCIEVYDHWLASPASESMNSTRAE